MTLDYNFRSRLMPSSLLPPLPFVPSSLLLSSFSSSPFLLLLGPHLGSHWHAVGPADYLAPQVKPSELSFGVVAAPPCAICSIQVIQYRSPSPLQLNLSSS